MPPATGPDGRVLRGLTIDAMGCLVAMPDPTDRLLALVATRIDPPPDRAAVARALRAEIAHYRAGHLRGRDAGALRALQRECVGVFLAALGAAAGESPPARPGRGPGAPPDHVPPAVDDPFLDAFLAALAFEALPGVADALVALRAAGLRLVCVSNWDAGLPAHLDRLGLLPLLDGVVTSAEAGVAKPDPAIFALALERLGLPAAAVAHLGDEPVDRDGAAAAGLGFLDPPVADLPARLGVAAAS